MNVDLLGAAVVIGGTSGIGHAVANALLERGCEVIITSRDQQTARDLAERLGPLAVGMACDLTSRDSIQTFASALPVVQSVVFCAVHRDLRRLRQFSAESAAATAQVKLHGPLELISALRCKLARNASITLFSGIAKFRPYPGSTTISIANAGIGGMVAALVSELAPTRVNQVTPGFVRGAEVVDTNHSTAELAAHVDTARLATPTGQLPSTADVVDAVLFLIRNPSVNGLDLIVDGGLHAGGR